MSQAGITLIIVGITCVLYVIEKLPVALVTVLGMLAMVFAGSVSFKDAFSNFGSTPAMLVFGMVIIIDAIIDSGVITEFENVLMKMTRHGEKTFLILILLSAGVISVFSNNTALVAMFMPFIASVADNTRQDTEEAHISSAGCRRPYWRNRKSCGKYCTASCFRGPEDNRAEAVCILYNCAGRHDDTSCRCTVLLAVSL